VPPDQDSRQQRVGWRKKPSSLQAAAFDRPPLHSGATGDGKLAAADVGHRRGRSEWKAEPAVAAVDKAIGSVIVPSAAVADDWMEGRDLATGPSLAPWECGADVLTPAERELVLLSGTADVDAALEVEAKGRRTRTGPNGVSHRAGAAGKPKPQAYTRQPGRPQSAGAARSSPAETQMTLNQQPRPPYSASRTGWRPQSAKR
jgi:hypothetical protein